MLGSNQATRLPNRKQRSGGKLGKQTIPISVDLEKKNYKDIKMRLFYLEGGKVELFPPISKCFHSNLATCLSFELSALQKENSCEVCQLSEQKDWKASKPTVSSR